jgi:hypothetical protein
MHESFYPDGYWRFTRTEFGWANAWYAELLFRSVAGYAESPFVHGGTIVPFEQRSATPRLVSPIVEIDNAADIAGTLGRLLDEGREAAINQGP